MFDARRDPVDADNDALWMLLGALSVRGKALGHAPPEGVSSLRRVRLVSPESDEDQVLLATLGVVSLLERVPAIAAAAAAAPKLGGAEPDARPSTSAVVLSLREALR